jgi:hypothetical protein
MKGTVSAEHINKAGTAGHVSPRSEIQLYLAFMLMSGYRAQLRTKIKSHQNN